MAEGFRGLSRSGRDHIWIYRRTYPKRLQHLFDQKNFVKSTRTADPVEARRKAAAFERQYSQMVRRAELEFDLSGSDSKNVRRQFFWSAVARWLREYAAQNNGRLPLPVGMEVPVRTGLTSHPFIFVRSSFTVWAQVNEPDAVHILHTTDATQGDLFFHHALVGAYFIVRELLRPGPLPSGTSVPHGT